MACQCVFANGTYHKIKWIHLYLVSHGNGFVVPCYAQGVEQPWLFMREELKKTYAKLKKNAAKLDAFLFSDGNVDIFRY